MMIMDQEVIGKINIHIGRYCEMGDWMSQKTQMNNLMKEFECTRATFTTWDRKQK